MLPTGLSKAGRVSEFYSEHVKDPWLSFGRVAGNGGSGFSGGSTSNLGATGRQGISGVFLSTAVAMLGRLFRSNQHRLCKVSDDEPTEGDSTPCIYSPPAKVALVWNAPSAKNTVVFYA